MASLDDILTTQKNGVIAINNLAQYLKDIVTNTDIVAPSTTGPTVLASTAQLITTGSGRIFAVSVPDHAGSGRIYVYDCATTGAATAANCIFSTDAANAANFLTYYNVNLAYKNGIVIKTDASMNCCVAYTPTT